MRKLTMMAVTLALLAGCGPAEQGPTGPAGATGPQGPKGDPGTPGAGLTARYFCFGTGVFFAGTSATAYYTRYDFADGSAFVDCSVTPSNANRQRKDALFPLFYRSTDAEIANGDCQVNHDMDTTDGSGAGVFEFRVPKGSTQGRATYRDNSSGYDGAIVSLDCLAN